MLKKLSSIIGFAVLTIVICSSTALAAVQDCINEQYPSLLSTEENEDYPYECKTVDIDGKSVTLYAETSANCLFADEFAEDLADNPRLCKEESEVVDLFEPCVGEGKEYPNLSTKESSDYPIKCSSFETIDGRYGVLWGKTSADCASASKLLSSRKYACADEPDTDFVEEYRQCMGEGRKYPGLSPTGPSEEYPVMCPAVNYGGKMVAFFGKTMNDCSITETVLKLDSHDCEASSHYTVLGQIVKIAIPIFTIVCALGVAIGSVIIICKKKQTPSEPTEPSDPETQM